MAHKCNYRLFAEKFITTELSFNSSINTFASFSTTGMIDFMNLEVRLRLRATVEISAVGCCSITKLGSALENICFHFHCFRRIMRNLLIKMEHFDWLNTFQSTYCVFLIDVSLTWSSSFSLKASQLQRSLYRSLEELKDLLNLPFQWP